MTAGRSIKRRNRAEIEQSSDSFFQPTLTDVIGGLGYTRFIAAPGAQQGVQGSDAGVFAGTTFQL